MPQVAHVAHQILQEFRPVPVTFTNIEVIYKRPLDPVAEPITAAAAMPDPQAPAIAAGRGVRCDNPDCGLAIWVERAVAAMAVCLAASCGTCGTGWLRVGRPACGLTAPSPGPPRWPGFRRKTAT